MKLVYRLFKELGVYKRLDKRIINTIMTIRNNIVFDVNDLYYGDREYIDDRFLCLETNIGNVLGKDVDRYFFITKRDSSNGEKHLLCKINAYDKYAKDKVAYILVFYTLYYNYRFIFNSNGYNIKKYFEEMYKVVNRYFDNLPL